MYVPFRILFLFAWLGLASFLQAQVVDQLISPDSLEITGGNVVIVFDDLRADTSDTNFQAEHSDTVGGWTGMTSLSVVEHSSIADRYTLTAPAPPGPRKFYRIIGYSTTAEDSDGDGLSDVLEGTLGTNALLFDSDNDGFSDGAEFANNTDPDDAGEVPDLAVFPQVQFVETLSTTTEGDGAHAISIVFDKPYSGTVLYQIHLSGTGVEGEDFTSGPGVITFNGTRTGSLSITSIENRTVDPHRLIMIDLIDEDTTRTYRTGGRSRHILCLADNDHYWSGTLTSDLLVRNFRIERTFIGSVSEIDFVAGFMDGLPAVGGGSSETTGVVPDGSHAASVISDTGNLFDVAVSFPSITESKLFGTKLNAQRVLTLEAITGASFSKIVEGRFLDGAEPPMPLVPNGPHTVVFNIYDDLTASGAGNLKWGPSTQLVDFSGGRFETILSPTDDLPSATPLPDVFTSGDDRYLGITIQGMPEISPRNQLFVPAQHSIAPNQIVGIYTETVGTDLVPNASATDVGIFALVRNPSAAPAVGATPYTP